MDHLDGLLEFLYREKPEALEILARGGNPRLNAPLADYLPSGDDEDEDLAPDSQEASEAASLDGQYIGGARRTWRKLTPEAQAGLLAIFAAATGPTTMSGLTEYMAPDLWL